MKSAKVIFTIETRQSSSYIKRREKERETLPHF